MFQFARRLTRLWPAHLHSRREPIFRSDLFLNQQVPYATTSGLPFYILGNVGRQVSTDVIARALAKTLYARGVDVRLRPFASDKIEDLEEWLSIRRFLHQGPTQASAVLTIHLLRSDWPQRRFAYEAHMDGSDSFMCFDPAWVKRMNQLDQVLTFSNFSAGIMRQQGVERVAAVPLGVAQTIFKPQATSEELPAGAVILFSHGGVRSDGDHNYLTAFKQEAPFVFHTAGMIQHRKGAELTIEAYCRSFRAQDNVLLWIHGRQTAWGTRETLDYMKTYARVDSPAMLWTDGVLSAGQLSAMLNRADVYVSTHRLEGFGLLPLEAMACGTPSILTAYGGPLEYASEETSYLVPYTKLVPARHSQIPAGVTWAELSVEAISEQMRTAWEDPALRQAKAKAGRREARGWSWGRAAETLHQLVDGRVNVARRLTRPQSSHDQPSACAILVPVRNGARDIERLLTSLFATPAGYPFRVYVYNDGSTDTTAEVLAPWQNRIKVFSRADPRGAPHARNFLLSATEEPWCFQIDCDLEFFQPNWLAQLIETARQRPQAAVVAPMLIHPDGTIQSAGGEWSPTVQAPAQHRFYRQPVSAAAEQPQSVLYAPLAAWLMRREIIDRLGGFQEVYFPTAFEDVDYSELIRRAGYEVFYDGRIQLIHHEGSFRRRSGDPSSQNRRYWEMCWGDRY